MKTSRVAAVLVLKALILGGCAASPSQGAQVRVHTTTAAFEHHASSHAASAEDSARPARKESPLAHACKTGSSKTCNELGDGLAIKHAHAEARQWYETSCERVRSAMLPNATRLMQVSQDLKQLDSSESPQASAELKNDAAEIRARIQGCLDVGESLKTDHELKQALKYYDAVCEFSTLVEVVGEAAPALQHVTESGCAAGADVRAELGGAQFSPRMFADLAQPQEQAPARPSKSNSEEGMVFSEGDL